MHVQIREISQQDQAGLAQVDELLLAEGIQRDGHLDYICGAFDEDEQLIATGSCFQNTLRCLAVSSRHRGEALLNQLTAHLMEVQLNRGCTHLFLYTKPDVAPLMADLGFWEIARVEDALVFMENRRTGFASFCRRLEKKKVEAPRIASIVMNANPFTRGHQYLVERVAAENDVVHLFVLSEEAGPIPFAIRWQLVQEGTAHFDHVVLHPSGPYMISSATFPSYFLKDQDSVIRTQAQLDLRIFGTIAQSLGIQRRYAGHEPNSRVTALYNQTMAQQLPVQGIEFVELPRLEQRGAVISASTVRGAIHDGALDSVRDALPESTYRFFAGPEGAAVCAAIRGMPRDAVIHY